MKNAGLLVLSVFLCLAPAYAQQPEDQNGNGPVIGTELGADFDITLEANYITGEKWELSEPLNPDMLSLVKVEDKLGIAKFQGRGGKQIWTFKALSLGKTVISLKSPSQEKIFTVDIKEPSPPEE